MRGKSSWARMKLLKEWEMKENYRKGPTSFGQGSLVLHRGSCALWVSCPKPWNAVVLVPTLVEWQEHGPSRRTGMGSAEAAGKTSEQLQGRMKLENTAEKMKISYSLTPLEIIILNIFGFNWLDLFVFLGPVKNRLQQSRLVSCCSPWQHVLGFLSVMQPPCGMVYRAPSDVCVRIPCCWAV